jgi:hypothetical protein
MITNFIVIPPVFWLFSKQSKQTLVFLRWGDAPGGLPRLSRADANPRLPSRCELVLDLRPTAMQENHRADDPMITLMACITGVEPLQGKKWSNTLPLANSALAVLSLDHAAVRRGWVGLKPPSLAERGPQSSFPWCCGESMVGLKIHFCGQCRGADCQSSRRRKSQPTILP